MNSRNGLRCTGCSGLLMRDGSILKGFIGWVSDFSVKSMVMPPVQWESYFPRSVNNIYGSYVVHNNIETPGSPRLKTPTDAEPDDGSYSNMLRPGLILS